MNNRFAIALLAGTLLLTGCGGGEAPVATYEYAKAGTYHAEIDPAGQLTCVGSYNHGGSLWDSLKNARRFSWNHQTGQYSLINRCAFSGDGLFALTAEQQQFVRWDTNTGQPSGFWSTPAEILDIDLISGGSTALIGLADHTALLFDLNQGGARQILRHDARVRAVALAANNPAIAITGSDDYQATLWDLNTGKVLFKQTFGNVVDTVALSSDGRLAFSSGSLNKAIIWRTDTGKIVHTLTSSDSFFAQRISYLAARFSPAGDKLLTGSASGMVQLWDVNSGQELKRWKLATRELYGPVATGTQAVGFGQGYYLAFGSNGLMNLLR